MIMHIPSCSDHQIPKASNNEQPYRSFFKLFDDGFILFLCPCGHLGSGILTF